MSPARPPNQANVAASVRARLLNVAKTQGVDFNQVLVRFALERILYRLTQSQHADRFLLKGALLFTLWYDMPHRATRDADLLGFGASDLASVAETFRDIAAVAVDDGIAFDAASVTVEEIRKEAGYGGVRVIIAGELAKARCKTQIDVGFGDAVTPAPVDSVYPVLLDDLPAPRLRAYPTYTVIAEKLHTIALLGMTNTGERIRDKIAASKRKGMWMGGVPPLGYDVENRRLVPNEREAKLIRHIFQRFVELGSGTMLFKELKLDGVTSKTWTTQDGKTRDGKPIDKGLIYKLLNNRTYLGELRHKEQWYQAEHPPIIDRELWDKVHAILATNGRVRGNATRATVPYLLKGIVFGNDGRALSPFHTTKKNGRRYRYYVPQRENKEHAGASGLPRLPAAELESAVLDQLRAVLRSPDLLGDVLPRAIELDPSLDEAKVTVAMTRLDTIWDQLFPAEQTRIVKLLVEKVIVSPNDLEVRLRANGIERLVLELQPAGAPQPEEALA